MLTFFETETYLRSLRIFILCYFSLKSIRKNISEIVIEIADKISCEIVQKAHSKCSRRFHMLPESFSGPLSRNRNENVYGDVEKSEIG